MPTGAYVKLLVVVFTALIAKPQVSFFVVGLAYTISGPLGLYWRYRTGSHLERAEVPEPAPGPAPSDPGPDGTTPPEPTPIRRST